MVALLRVFVPGHTALSQLQPKLCLRLTAAYCRFQDGSISSPGV